MNQQIETSVWGEGDEATYELLAKEPIHGKWLNFAAGDGRYNEILLKKADEVIASDIDVAALDSLVSRTADELRPKLKTSIVDLIKKFPFENETFDGVFCVGTLHLFSQEKLEGIFEEIQRILKRGGKFIFDFATDVRRVLPDGTLYKFEDEPEYNLEQAKDMLKKLLKDYMLEIIESEVPEEEISLDDVAYKFQCRFLLGVGIKS